MRSEKDSQLVTTWCIRNKEYCRSNITKIRYFYSDRLVLRISECRNNMINIDHSSSNSLRYHYGALHASPSKGNTLVGTVAI